MSTKQLKFAEKFFEVLNLLYYDGPLLSYYRDGQGRHFLVLWADEIPATERERAHDAVWYSIEATRETMEKYFKDELSLLQVMEISPVIYESNGAFIEENGDAFGSAIKFADVPDDRKPTADAFCNSSEALSYL